MDEIGRRYLLLVLRLRRHLPDLVAVYIGPGELAEAVQAEAPAPAEELHLEAMALQSEVAERTGGGEAEDRRRGWLSDQLGALATSARLLAGEEIGFVDLVEELYGIAAEVEPEVTFSSARHHLADILPPGRTLAARLAAHNRSVTLPAEAVPRALRRLSNALRQRTVRDVWLPEGESVEFAVAGEHPTGFAATYLGGLRSRVAVNAGSPLRLDRLLHLAAHEAYPGHHAEHATKEALLIREHDRGEAMVTTRFTPSEAISEGIAGTGRGLVLDDQELGGVLRRLVRDLGAPIPDAAVAREVLVARARSQLARANADGALMAWHEGVPQAEVRAWLAKTALSEDEELDRQMRRLATLRDSTAAFRRLAGPRVMAEWLEVQGHPHGLGRLLAEPLTPRLLREEISAAAG